MGNFQYGYVTVLEDNPEIWVCLKRWVIGSCPAIQRVDDPWSQNDDLFSPTSCLIYGFQATSAFFKVHTCLQVFGSLGSVASIHELGFQELGVIEHDWGIVLNGKPVGNPRNGAAWKVNKDMGI